MKSNRFRYSYRDSASTFHQVVGDLLRSSNLFSNQELYQEYPVSKVNSSYSDSRHRFDWVIPKLKLVIECMGQQHFFISAFDGDWEKAFLEFPDLQARDRAKKEAALQVGFIYIAIPYTFQKKITESLLLELIELGKEELEEYTEEHGEQKSIETPRQKYLKSDKHKEVLKKAREYRRRQYLHQKELKND